MTKHSLHLSGLQWTVIMGLGALSLLVLACALGAVILWSLQGTTSPAKPLATTPAQVLIGKWEWSRQDPVYIEFFPDGTVSMATAQELSNPVPPPRSQYSILDDNHVSFSGNRLEEWFGTSSEFQIEGDSLTLSSPTLSTVKLKRVK